MEESLNNNVKKPTTRLRLALAIGAIAMALAGTVDVFGDTVPSTQPVTDSPAALPDSGGATTNLIVSGLDESGDIVLEPTKTRRLTSTRKIREASVISGDIAAVKALSPTEILIMPKSAGTTQLIVRDESDRTQVIPVVVQSDLVNLAKQLKVLFPADKIELDEVHGTLAVRGQVKNLEEASQIIATATPYSAKVLNFLEVGGGQQVMLKVRFAEVTKDAETQLGLNFGFRDGTSFFGNNVGPNPFGTTAATGGGSLQVLSALSPTSAIQLFGQGAAGKEVFQYFIQALQTNNVLRMLAEPDLVTISGQEANFLAGGEIPIPVPQPGSGGVTITIEYKKYGIQLSFVPIVLGDGHIRLKVAPEVSELDYGHAIDINGSPVPALTDRTVNTTVEMAQGQTLAIAGLLSHDDTATVTKVPGLGDIPVLAALFRSVQYQRDETELVVLVTPVLVQGMNPADVPATPGERWRYPNESDMFFLGDIGGEAANADHAPVADGAAAPKFQGAYGFQPPAPTPGH